VSAKLVSKEIGLSATSHDFGNVRVDSASHWTFYIKSVGTDTLTVSNISKSLAGYSLSATSGQIDPSNTLGITVSFTPAMFQVSPDILKIYSGRRLPVGIYYYQIRAGSFLETKKMILLP
jgi:hypothetical protein